MEKNKYVKPISIYSQFTNKNTNEIRLGLYLDSELYLYDSNYKAFDLIPSKDERKWERIHISTIEVFPTKLSIVSPFSEHAQTLVGVFEVNGMDYSLMVNNESTRKVSNKNIEDVTITDDSSSYSIAVVRNLPYLFIHLISHVSILYGLSQLGIFALTLGGFMLLIFNIFLILFSTSEISETNKIYKLTYSTLFTLIMNKRKETLPTHNLPFFRIGKSGVAVIRLKAYSLGSESTLKTNFLQLVAKEYYKKTME